MRMAGIYEQLMNDAQSGRAALPRGGTVSTDPRQLMGPETQASGTVRIPSSRVENDPGLATYLKTGVPRAQQRNPNAEMQQMGIMDAALGRIENRRKARESISSLRDQGISDERIKELMGYTPGMSIAEGAQRLVPVVAQNRLQGARDRQASGQMTVNDALALGILNQRYGGVGGDDKQGYIDRVFNAPQLMGLEREQQAKQQQQTQVQNLMNSAVKAGTLIPKVNEGGQVTGFAVPESEQPWQPSVLDLMGDETPDVLMTSPNSAVQIRQEARDESPLYVWEKGMPTVIPIDNQTVGILNQDKRRYDLQPIRRQKIWGVNPANGLREEYMAPNYDISGMPTYKQWISFSTEDRQALEWAQANPKDERSESIFRKLGVK